MVRWGFICILISFAWSTLCFAGESVQKAATGGDICDIRPDLCGGPAKVTKKSAKKKKLCRRRNDEREEVLHLPVCGSATADLSGDIEKELMMEESTAELAATGKRTRKREVRAQEVRAPEVRGQQVETNIEQQFEDEAANQKPARSHRMNYNDYINQNANHPALANRRSGRDQTAFSETKRVYISPVVPGTPGAAGAPAANGATAAAGGATTTAPGANPATGTASGIPPASGIGAAPGIAPAAGIAPVHSGTTGGDPNQTNNYGSDGNQPPPGSSAGN